MTESHFNTLRKMAKHDDPKVRNVIIGFLPEANKKEVLTLLKEALSDNEWYVRATAVFGVGKSGGIDHIDWIKPLLNDPVPYVVNTVEESIENLKKK